MTIQNNCILLFTFIVLTLEYKLYKIMCPDFLS